MHLLIVHITHTRTIGTVGTTGAWKRETALNVNTVYLREHTNTMLLDYKTTHKHTHLEIQSGSAECKVLFE